MMHAAIACDDPVVYLEHKNIWALEGEVDTALKGEFGKARIRCTGDDLTIVTWSDTANKAEAAAQELAAEGIRAEVIDLVSLWPWDKRAVLASVAKTGRLLVAHESVSTGGFGAEIVATVVQEADLRARPRRLASPRSLVSYAPNLENQLRVTTDMIVRAGKEMTETVLA